MISFFGFFSHLFYKRFGLKKGHLAWIFYYGLVVVGFFLILDILIYYGMFDSVFPFLNRIFPWCHIDNGRDFMWNSLKIFGIDWNINYNDSGLDIIAWILFFSFPLWYFAFKDLSRKLFGGNRNRPYEKGLIYLFSSNKPEDKDEE
ncbi:MAG: hypothetical protein P8Y70_20815 [Candidatus Lokiarchaeota archaeon]